MARIRDANGSYRMMTPTEVLAEFYEKAEPVPEAGCWIWTGHTRTRSGYGAIRYRYAHRYSYEIHKGKIPKGMCVCHACDTPACVNPDHLWLGTLSDNFADMRKKGRGGNGSLPGETHPMHKLTDAEALVIRKRFDAGESQSGLAREFNVSQATVWQIGNRRTWRHLDA